jgi:hypothetical protein
MTLTLLDQPEEEGHGQLLAVPDGFPAPPQPAAFHGLAGQIVTSISPHTEADPVAILAQLLVAFGAAVGRHAWFAVEATRHHPNEFLVLVGDSAKARKGSSWDHVARLLEAADPSLSARTLTGLSSGEGVIWAVRDPTDTDPGIIDRRLLVVEPEFASVLKAASRDISTLSPTLRAAWDGRPLAILTRSAPARASDAHITLIGHITSVEFQHHVSPVEAANGLLNRVLFIACRRIRLLPDGGRPDPTAGTGLDRQLALAVAASRDGGQLKMTADGRAAWHRAYQQLAEPQPGLAGQLTARAEAHAIRLALIYALLDRAPAIGPEHVGAALALHDYAARSAAWAIEPRTDDPLAQRVHAALRHARDGLTRSQLLDLLHRNVSARRLDQVLANLAAADKIDRQRVLTAGRPAELWTAKKP